MIDTFLDRLSAAIAAFFADPFASEPDDDQPGDTHRDAVTETAGDAGSGNDFVPFSWAIHGHW